MINMYDSTSYVRKKNGLGLEITAAWTFTCRLVVCHRAARSHQPHSRTNFMLSVDSMSLHCLSLEENGFLLSPPSPPLMSPLKREFSMNPSVYFIRWLLFIGAFWLHSAHLGSLRVCWHFPHITWGTSHLKTTLQLWLQKPHPGTH